MSARQFFHLSISNLSIGDSVCFTKLVIDFFGSHIESMEICTPCVTNQRGLKHQKYTGAPLEREPKYSARATAKPGSGLEFQPANN